MKALLKRGIQDVLRRFNLAIVNRQYLDHLVRSQVAEDDLRRIAAMGSRHAGELLRLLPHSKSQLRQDLFVLSELGFKREGYFVEFGAADGIQGSNSFLLEQAYGWKGILAEPAKVWHAALVRNRSGSRVDTRCVWSESGATVSFREVEEAGYSTVDTFSDADMHRQLRSRGSAYDVETVSLVDLLGTHGAPAEIDYLSIDTEGSEFEILSRFDFDRYRFNVITCEHNYTPMREELYALLTSKGYVRKLEEASAVDDWYVRAT